MAEPKALIRHVIALHQQLRRGYRSGPATVARRFPHPESREAVHATRRLLLKLTFCFIALLAPAVFGAVTATETQPAAGPRYTIDVWKSDDGLPQNSVICMTQTRDGYLWLGTLNGLVRFDGLQFVVFDEGNTPGLNSSVIVSLFEDSQGNLWVGTETGGVALVKDGVVTNLGLGRGSSEGRLAAICEDPTGAVWLYTADGRLWRYQEGRIRDFSQWTTGRSTTRALIADTTGAVRLGMDWYGLVIDAAGAGERVDLPSWQPLAHKLDLLLASAQGGYWQLAGQKVTRVGARGQASDVASYPWSGTTRVMTSCEDQQGNLVVGTWGEGLFWFDSKGKSICISTNEGLSHSVILSMKVDREGTLWVGTDGGGLNRIKRQAFEVLEGSLGLTIQSVSEDAQGGLWFGSNGEGAGYWKDRALRRFGREQGLTNWAVLSVFADRDQRVWFGSGEGFLQLAPDGAITNSANAGRRLPLVRVIHEDREGRLWLGTPLGLWRGDAQRSEWQRFRTGSGLTADEVRAIAEDKDGNLWIGTRGGGLSRFVEGKFSASFHKQDGLPSEDISSLLLDAEGVLWIGTSSGLGRFHLGKWTRYTTREGLISNGIGYLIEDGQGYLWMGSNTGLMRVSKASLNELAAGRISVVTCRGYGAADGLPASECTRGSQPAACRTRDGRLWFPTIKGLASVNPAELHPNTNPPPVLIESVFLDGQSQETNHLRAPRPQIAVIAPDTELLEIHYTSLNLAGAERARFRYRLEGYDNGWTEAGNGRVAMYRKLPPGSYRFRVMASNEDGVWNETGGVLAVRVDPPFWRTWWFITAVTLSVLGGIVGIVHYVSTQKLQRQLAGLRQQEAVEKERARIARDIHDQLGANLTQVSLLGEMVETDKNEPAEVEAHARQISQTARETTRALDEIVWTVNPSNDTLDGLINYVCKYAQEYLAVAGLRYRLDVPADLPETPISPEVRHNVFLAAKEAVTNVVRHAQASEVRIHLHLEPNRFDLEIQDDGRGLGGMNAKAAESRNGLRNMRKRMEDVGGTFSMTPGPERGTLTRLSVPIGKR